MPQPGYRTVALKEVLIERLDRFVAGNVEGYTNRSEVIHAAIREFLDRHEAPALPPEAMDKAIKQYLERLMEEEQKRRQT